MNPRPSKKLNCPPVQCDGIVGVVHVALANAVASIIYIIGNGEGKRAENATCTIEGA